MNESGKKKSDKGLKKIMKRLRISLTQQQEDK